MGGGMAWVNYPSFLDYLLQPPHSVLELLRRFPNLVRVVDHVRRKEDHSFRAILRDRLRAEKPSDHRQSVQKRYAGGTLYVRLLNNSANRDRVAVLYRDLS